MLWRLGPGGDNSEACAPQSHGGGQWDGGPSAHNGDLLMRLLLNLPSFLPSFLSYRCFPVSAPKLAPCVQCLISGLLWGDAKDSMEWQLLPPPYHGWKVRCWHLWAKWTSSSSSTTLGSFEDLDGPQRQVRYLRKNTHTGTTYSLSICLSMDI